MDKVDFIIAFESGEVDDDQLIEGFQAMIDDGSVWSLQGSYGRTAAALIEAGHCQHAQKQHFDYYGNPLPTAG